MGENTQIEWCDHTFNPWTGCTKISPGCRNCYAEKNRARFGFNDEWGPSGVRRRTGAGNWSKPLAWNRRLEGTGERETVFCASLADVFENRPELVEWRADLLDLVRATPNLDWLILTKRPENIATEWRIEHNVWLGTSVETQAQASRIQALTAGVAPTVAFLSCEPLLGPLDIDLGGIDWVIAGGESGPGARPMNPEWARSLQAQCEIAGAAFLFKQWGEHDASGVKVGKKKAGRVLDGRTWDEYPIPAWRRSDFDGKWD